MKPIRISGDASFSPRGWVVYGAALAWIFLSWGFAAWLVRNMGLDPPAGGPRALIGAVAFVLITFGPLLAWGSLPLLVPHVYRTEVPRILQPFTRLGPMAVLDEVGLVLWLPGSAERRFEWTAIGGIAAGGRHEVRLGNRTLWRTRFPRSGSLLGRDGRPMLSLPGSIVGGPLRRTLAEALVEVRPNRYVLTGASAPDGRPDACGLAGSVSALDLDEFRRSQRRHFRGQMLQVLVLGLLGLAFYFVVVARP